MIADGDIISDNSRLENDTSRFDNQMDDTAHVTKRPENNDNTFDKRYWWLFCFGR